MIRDWVELNMTPGIGPRAAAKLLERFGSAEAVYSATRTELELLRLVPEAVDSIIARDLQAKAESEIRARRVYLPPPHAVNVAYPYFATCIFAASMHSSASRRSWLRTCASSS